MADNMELIGKRVRPKSGTGYTGIYIIRGVTTSGLAYAELAHVPGHIRSIEIDQLEIVEDEPAPAQEVADGG